ncbi:ubiquitin conjugation factor E4 A isoform X2 [Daktulosphaira vitifoliae]|uniref:ubiquitin conjugation factor E4 A isoform X2 n=1 Tax=Daktulosphaira vitifoliae TaxID=58002 RepID=UPI0021A98968|nr:ubiquitin conjugation factor E4 A isoform X2 [Daktulosphaira vitifoliae]
MSEGNEFSIFKKKINDQTQLCPDDSTSNPEIKYADNCIDETFNKFVEKIFHFTLKPNFDKEYNASIVYLPDITEILKYYDGNQTDIEMLEQAIFERILLPKPDSYLMKYKQSVSINEHTIQKKCIIYLFECFLELNLMQQQNCYPSINDNVYEIIRGFLYTNVSTALKQPDLYDSQNISLQILDIFKNNKATMEDFMKFLTSINKLIIMDEDDQETQLKIIYQPVLDIIKEKIKEATIIFLPNCELAFIQVISSDVLLAKVLIDYCHVPIEATGYYYTDTLLGALFAISGLPRSPGGQFEFFLKPMEELSGPLENNIWNGMDTLHQQLHLIFLHLLKSGPEVKHKTLLWLGSCLEKNSGRCKLWNIETSMLEFISDGFAINLSAVLLKLCQPFISNTNNMKLLKIDPTYCAAKVQNIEESKLRGVHLRKLDESTMLLPTNSENPDDKRPVSKEIGFAQIQEKMTNINQDLARMQQTFMDTQQSGSATSEVMKLINDRMEAEMTKYLSMKAALLEPSTLHLLSQFQKATCVWLVQVVCDIDKDFNLDTLQSYCPDKFNILKFPMASVTSPTLKCIPEFVLDNIWRYLMLVRRFHSRSLEEPGFELVSELLNAILVFMMSNDRVRNPHLRARLAECLDCLLPHPDEDITTTNSIGSYYRQMLFLNHPHRKQIVHALLDVFVGIEMTGQSVEFEQKFNYRRPMYIVMDYLWKLDEHREVFKELATSAESNMEATTPPLFLRFINLLMNDAVFLLDEALTNMAQLKQLQTALDAGEWNNLSQRERNQNMAHFQHIGMIARFDNILGRETINTFKYLTSEIKSIFCHSTMVERIAAMLNYFLCHLVGPKKKNFKVKDMKEYKFEPAEIVLNICTIYLHLGESDYGEAFCLAISKDGRSYNSNLFKQAEDVLVRIGGSSLIPGMANIASKVSKHAIQQSNDDELLLSEIPENFLDPIMSTIMTDPVTLPSSKVNVDRSTILRHFLNEQTDPFTRSPLTMDMVKSNVELKKQIDEWIKGKKSTSK